MSSQTAIRARGKREELIRVSLSAGKRSIVAQHSYLRVGGRAASRRPPKGFRRQVVAWSIILP